MKTSWAVLILLLFCVGCSGDALQDREGTGDRRFRTTPPSLLYFKNMRSTKYTLEEQPVSRIELYKLNAYKDKVESPVLYPVIANNWLVDEAYLFLEPNDWSAGFLSPLAISTDTLWSSPVLELQPSTPQRQYELALMLYDGLIQGSSWYVAASDSTFVPLFEDKSDRTYFLTTVRDFLKLTDQER